MKTAEQALPVAVPDDERDRLEHIMHLQAEYQQFMYGSLPKDLPLNEKIEAFRTMFIALVCEAVEVMDEVGWKPWATSRFINEEKARGEVVDELHFVMNKALLLGMTPDSLYEKYVEKNERNRKRQREGYTGVDEKCIVCGRDVTDVKVATGLAPLIAATSGTIDNVTEEWYCGECGRGFTKVKHP